MIKKEKQNKTKTIKHDLERYLVCFLTGCYVVLGFYIILSYIR